jgi:sterol desaturase/sphingolipid hydroxylase (fatty acid hydroxylase superfamily)
MEIIDNTLAGVWSMFIDTKLAKWGMLEAYVAGGSFAIWIVMFRIMDQIPSLHKYRMSKKDPIRLFQPDPNNSWAPLVLYILAIHIYHVFVTKPPVSIHAPSFTRVIVELVAGIFLYDFIFFWLHWSMHTFRVIGTITGHHVHHTQNQLCASEVQHHSFVDGSLQVVVNIIVQNCSLPWFGRKHLLSRLLHNVVITFLLTEIHAGYDAPFSLHNVMPYLYGGAKRHEVHHSHGKKYYQQFFMYLDDSLQALHTLHVLFRHLVREFHIRFDQVAYNVLTSKGVLAVMLSLAIFNIAKMIQL